MARKTGLIVAGGASTWLVRVYLGRDPQTRARKYPNHTRRARSTLRRGLPLL
jgi:hypothetical protein